MTAAVTCPRCRAPIEPSWDWCHACGFDPEGLKPAGWQPPVAAAPRPPAGPAWATTPAPPRAAAPGPAPASGSGSSPVRILVVAGVVLVAILLVSIGTLKLVGDRPETKIGVAPVASATTTSTGVAGWTPWTSPDGSLTASFPTAPVAASPPTHLDLDLRTVTEVRSTQGTLVYGALVADIIHDDPHQYFTDDDALNAAMYGLGAGVGRSEVPGSGGKAYDFEVLSRFDADPTSPIGVSGSFREGRGRVQVVGNRLLAVYAYREGGDAAVVKAGPDVDWPTFVASFQPH